MPIKVEAKANPPTPTDDPKTLTDVEQEDFERLEDVIRVNYKSTYELAAAMAEIRNRRLHREFYNTFEEYCKERWKYSRSYCERLADMDGVIQDLKGYEGSDVMPRNELQARVFVSLNKDQRVELLKTVLAESKTDITTASEFAKFKKRLFPDLCPEKPKKPKPAKVIDVEATTVHEPALPNIIKVVDAAEDLLEKLDDNEVDDGTVAEELRAFLRLAEPLLEYQKQQASKRN
jgi:hypothetical protein